VSQPEVYPLLHEGTALQLPAKMRHRSFQLHSLSSILYSTCIFIALPQHSQVRSETLSGYISILSTQSLASCLEECLFSPITEGAFQVIKPAPQSNGVFDILHCPMPVDNACYCNSDQSHLVTSGISSCIIKDCPGGGPDHISAVIQVYTQYCSSVYVEVTSTSDLPTTTATAIPTTLRTPNSSTSTPTISSQAITPSSSNDKGSSGLNLLQTICTVIGTITAVIML